LDARLDNVSAMGEGILDMKKLLLVAALLLPAAMARAEDNVSKVNTAPESATAAPDHPTTNNTPANCADKLGVARIAEVDTTGGGEYGEQYAPKPLLGKGEVVITFDDGPHPKFTREILDALAAQCTKATFFNVGEMIKEFPDIARQVQAEGHTVGTHTYTHRNLGALSLERAKSQIESTINVAEATLPNGVAPFFRFPYLSDPKQVRDYLASRNIAIFGIDVDSFDWRMRSPEKVVANVTKGLEKVGGGIILFHDIHPQSAKAIPTVLAYLKEHGFKVVHLVPKSRIETVAMAEPAAEPAPLRRARRHRRASRR
jgi:peptidoglycan/xylan/chitin deacetylase (PgdA/CDA1 family)